MLNDVCKRSTADRLIKAMELERFRPTEVAEGFGISPSYISMMKKKVHWKNCPAKAWELVLAWVNSGDTLHHYFEKHSKTEGIIPTIEKLGKEEVKKKEQYKQEDQFRKGDPDLSVHAEKLEGESLVEKELNEYNSIRDPLEIVTSELEKAKRAFEKSVQMLYNHKIGIQLHITHVNNLVPKIHKLQEAVEKLSK